ncbi:hypothetical protein NMY22_g8613 [Coprinellus aureogranulatus]|nr:hypothetical protein NMY22_g8613 [Coprinellus aureogranulatus]
MKRFKRAFVAFFEDEIFGSARATVPQEAPSPHTPIPPPASQYAPPTIQSPAIAEPEHDAATASGTADPGGRANQHPAHRSLAEHHASKLYGTTPNSSTTETPINSTYSTGNVVCASILLELVVLRQYLKLKPTFDAELYEASCLLDRDEYQLLQDGDVAKRARLARQLTVHERAYASCRGDNALLQLKKNVDRTGIIDMEDPSDLTSVLKEDGTPYKFGSYTHQWKDDMTLTGRFAPPPASKRPPPTSSTTPQPFPLQLTKEGTAEPLAKEPLKITLPGRGKRKQEPRTVQTTLPFAPQTRSLRSSTRKEALASTQNSPPSKKIKVDR